MAVLTAHHQNKTSIFAAWKLWAFKKKKARLALMRRCLRTLRIAVQKKRQFRKMTLSVLGFKLQSNKNILKQCYDALR